MRMRPRRLPSFAIQTVSGISAAGPEPGSVRSASDAGSTCLSTAPFVASATSPTGTVAPLPKGDLGAWDSRVARILLGGLAGMLADVRAAVAAWGSRRVAVILGSSTGGILATEEALAEKARTGVLPETYDFDRQHAFHALLDVVSELTGARGPAYVISNACSSSGKVFASAQRLLSADQADAVLVGGADSLCSMTLRGFAGLKVLSRRPCMPFDRDRDGINIGEGSAFALVARDAPTPLAYLLGVGESSDAHHMTAPHPEGLGALEAMRAAMAIAGVNPAGVDYVHAHGTGTAHNDRTEALAVHSLFGGDVWVSSTKGVTGHLLGAAGALSAVVNVGVLGSGDLPVSVGLATPDPELDVRHVRHPTRVEVRQVLSNTFAFGGSNASVLLGARPASSGPSPPEAPIWAVSTAFWSPDAPSLDAALAGATFDEAVPDAALLPSRARGRASQLTRMFAEVVGRVTRGTDVDPSTAPMIFGSAYGEMDTTMSLLHRIVDGDGPLSPIRFQASVHNTALGAISIHLGNRAASTALAAGPRTAAMALLEAVAWLDAHGGAVIVALADEPPPAALVPKQLPSAAMAIALVAASAPPRGALARLERPSFGPVADTPGALSRFRGCPSAGALPLIEALASRRPGVVPIEDGTGERWRVRVIPHVPSG